ncbi:hypothetical protein [Streptomyces sp. NPDC002187]|uniref:hypothetical protein n=1 Tax=Streptomyces sp. NPDC002187 TaxID=3364637 RepID=UPI0036C2F29F
MTHPCPSDEDVLRRAFALIGEEAGRPEPEFEPGPVPLVPVRARTVWWRRRGVVLTAFASAAALCAGVIGAVLIDGGAAEPGATDHSGASGKGQTLVEWIACARTIAEGDVVTVRQSPSAGRVIVSFEVQEWIKPSRGEKRITLDVVDPTKAGVREPWREGQHLLIVVPQRRDLETDTFRGEQLTWYRGRIEEGLPEAATAECPPFWRDARG